MHVSVLREILTPEQPALLESLSDGNLEMKPCCESRIANLLILRPEIQIIVHQLLDEARYIEIYTGIIRYMGVTWG